MCIRDRGNIAASMGVVEKSAFTDQALHKLAVATVRSNHEIVYMCPAGLHYKAQGKALPPGLSVPCEEESATC